MHAVKYLLVIQTLLKLILNPPTLIPFAIECRISLISFEITKYRTEKTYLGTSGFHGDVLTLTRLLNARLTVSCNQVF